MTAPRRGILLALAALPLAPPACAILMLPVKLVGALASALFFWAAAPPPPPPGPLDAEAALAQVVLAGPEGPVWLCAEGAGPPPDAAAPPFEGAVPVRIELAPGTDPALLLRALAARGIPAICP